MNGHERLKAAALRVLELPMERSIEVVHARQALAELIACKHPEQLTIGPHGRCAQCGQNGPFP